MASKTLVVEAIFKTIPYPEQIRELDLDGEPSAIRFTWRGIRFRVDYKDRVWTEEVQGKLLSGSNTCLLMDVLLQQKVDALYTLSIP
jgi:hypothetical protein